MIVRPERDGARRPRPSPVARRTSRLIAAAWAAALSLGFLSAAIASDTQWWITTQGSDLARAESRGVVVDPDGVMRLGPRMTSFPAESLGVIWALVPLADGSIALAGDGGRIDRWTASGGVRRWVHLPVGQVLALARDGDGLVAGTAPGGVIYHVGARGDTALLCGTGERYVWGLAPGPRGVWYAATGTRGRLMRIEGGRARIVLDTDESNLVSILADGHGGVYAGGDSKGRVIHVSETGRARTAFDAAEEEVRALAMGSDGALYAAGMSIAAAPTATAAAITVTPAGAASPTGSDSDDDSDRTPTLTTVTTGGHATVYRIVPDSSATSWWVAPQPAIFALAAQGGALLAATGNRAGIYRVTDLNLAGALFLAPQGQVTALARAGDATWAATSNPGVLWRLGPEPAPRGELLSGTFDARRMARFGHLVWHGSGSRIGLWTRSGNTDPPDTTWSAWSGGEVGNEGTRIDSPPGRYLQWKLALDRGDERVDAIEASWREVNQPPRIEAITIAPQGATFREGELQPRSEPVTQTLPSGQKVEYSIGSAATPRALRTLPTWARGLRTVQWRGSDPDGDALRYTVEERSEGATNWIKIVDQLETPAFTWDTNPLPDSRYRLRVTATDANSNAVGEERVVRAESAPFSIDNTPPRITRLDAATEHGAVRIEGEAVDESGRLSQLDVATDEGDWRPLTPDGGLTDTPRATFHARLPGLTAGEHTVSVRATDLAGNAIARAVRVTVPREH